MSYCYHGSIIYVSLAAIAVICSWYTAMYRHIGWLVFDYYMDSNYHSILISYFIIVFSFSDDYQFSTIASVILLFLIASIHCRHYFHKGPYQWVELYSLYLGLYYLDMICWNVYFLYFKFSLLCWCFIFGVFSF